MAKQTLTDAEIYAMIAEMEGADFGKEIEVETVEDDDYEDDGQPTEYEEWQDFYGGDDWDQGQYDSMDY